MVPSPATGVSIGSGELLPGMHQLTLGAEGVMDTFSQLLKAQTDVMTAQVKAAAHYSGEGCDITDDEFDRWVERFHERAHARVVPLSVPSPLTSPACRLTEPSSLQLIPPTSFACLFPILSSPANNNCSPNVSVLYETLTAQLCPGRVTNCNTWTRLSVK